MFYSSLIGLPFSLYRVFVIEERHGFNKQTLRLFFVDMLKGWFLMIIIGAPLLCLLLWLIQWGGQYFYIYVWIFLLMVQLVAITIYPIMIQPWFNKLTPLSEGSLRDKIEELAKRLSFPLKKLFVIDGSKRSSHSNAYFYGFFKNKRIVLFDTLIAQTEEDEVVAILAHELGHWKLNHTLKTMFIVQVHMFILLYMFGKVIHTRDIYSSFGFTTMPTMIGLTLFQLLYSPVEHVLGFLMNLLSRKFEFQADAFAKDLGYKDLLRQGLIKLQTENLSDMNPDPWYSIYNYSHPPLVERLRAMEGEKQKESSQKQRTTRKTKRE
jgi:STE24 endopeptidase